MTPEEYHAAVLGQLNVLVALGGTVAVLVAIIAACVLVRSLS